jgi:hypothetical protein
MSDTLTTITHLINSPPGQLLAGGVLAGIVWKFFERVESVLNDDTKLEIAVWLLGRGKVSRTFQNWPDTFAVVFERVFGARHWSLLCVRRSLYVSILLSLLTLFFGLSFLPGETLTSHMVVIALLYYPYTLIANVLPDYLSLLSTRYALFFLHKSQATTVLLIVLAADLVITTYLACFGVLIGSRVWMYWPREWPTRLVGGVVSIGSEWQDWWKAPYLVLSRKGVIGYVDETGNRLSSASGLLLLVPALATSCWLWLYAGSGFLLKAARRFDIGFDWFNRHFDIEKKPLQSIGLVAGALVAVVYWTAVIVSRVVG